MSNISKLQLAKQRLQFVRGYTLKILEDVDDADWFRAPENLVTHIAWQVGQTLQFLGARKASTPATHQENRF